MTPSRDGVTPPMPVLPSPDWRHGRLYDRVKEAIAALPGHFRTETRIAGINATDIFTLNATLGATIEEQVVESLNAMRAIWDPADEYVMYRFVRQPQTFPDVLLRRYAHKPDEDSIILGIELKGWYLLAKEGEPSFRFQVTPSACNPQDLIVIVPWVLSDVISGSPKVFSPYTTFAKYAAEYRNYHWRRIRVAKGSKDIKSPVDVAPYPVKSDSICDRPVEDQGGNFGRFARTGLMDDYLRQAKSELIRGIEARHWLEFFKAFQASAPNEKVSKAIQDLASRIDRGTSGGSIWAVQVDVILKALGEILQGDTG